MLELIKRDKHQLEWIHLNVSRTQYYIWKNYILRQVDLYDQILLTSCLVMYYRQYFVFSKGNVEILCEISSRTPTYDPHFSFLIEFWNQQSAYCNTNVNNVSAIFICFHQVRGADCRQVWDQQNEHLYPRVILSVLTTQYRSYICEVIW